MIRLRKEKAPPIYQLEFSLQALRNGDEGLAKRLLNALPLVDVSDIELTIAANTAQTEEHGIIYSVPARQSTRIKVKYADADEWNGNKYKTHYLGNTFDLEHNDPRYHYFNHVGHFDVVQMDDHSMIAWYNREDGNTYCCHTYEPV